MEIYRNSVLRVRFLMVVGVAFLGTMALLANAVFTRYGLAPGEGGVLRPLGQRLALGGGLLALGLVFPLAMTVYGRRYVVRLAWREENRALEVETVGWLRRLRRLVPAADVVGARTREERFTGTAGVEQSTLWESVRVRGERLPLIVDIGNGEVLEPAALEALRDEGAPALLAPPPAAASATSREAHPAAGKRRRKH